MIKGYEMGMDIDALSESDIEWLLENEELMAIKNDPELKKKTVRVGDREIWNRSNARKGIIGALNKKRQRERQEKYWERVANGEDLGKIRIVSEGDSWFNYPTKLPEIIDHIFDDFSIFSVGYGGDWLANIYHEEEYLKALRLYKPDILLISGGGNDLVGGKRMLDVLKEYQTGARGIDLVKTDVFESILKDFSVLYEAIFSKVFNEFPDLKIVSHGYDYPYFEGKDKVWFGKPFKKKGIRNLQIQNEIGRHLIDEFENMMLDVVSKFDNVHYISNKGLVPRDQWKDELHPNEEGFRIVAERFRDKIREVAG